MKRKIRIKNKRKFISRMVILFAMVLAVNVMVSFAKYPEKYSTTWKYQLENELADGNKDALEYYNRVYVSNGKYLFGDSYIVEKTNANDYLNLATIVDVKISEKGITLITDNGNTYCLEGSFFND